MSKVKRTVLESRLRVTYQAGEPGSRSREDLDANHVQVANDGSLVIMKMTQRRSGVADVRGQEQVTVEQRLVRIIRRDLWREVETVDVEVDEAVEALAHAGPLEVQ